jgi:hypothetical protein
MRRLIAGSCTLLLLITPVTWAQTSQGQADSLDDRQPSENVRGGAVHQRAPGRVVDFARARHMGLRDARLAAQRSGDTSTLLPESDTITGVSGSQNPFLGLISSFLNTGLGGASNTGTASGGTGSAGGSSSGLPPEVIQMLTSFGIDVNSLNLKANESSAADATAPAKEAETSQTSTTGSERDFVVRWADAMLSTMFTSLTVAVSAQNTNFVDLLKSLFRPLFGLKDPNADASDGTTSSSSRGDSERVYCQCEPSHGFCPAVS